MLFFCLYRAPATRGRVAHYAAHCSAAVEGLMRVYRDAKSPRKENRVGSDFRGQRYGKLSRKTAYVVRTPVRTT